MSYLPAAVNYLPTYTPSLHSGFVGCVSWDGVCVCVKCVLCTVIER